MTGRRGGAAAAAVAAAALVVVTHRGVGRRTLSLVCFFGLTGLS